MAKFMQVMDNPNYNRLRQEARKRGITLQELLRAVIIPEWQEAYAKGVLPENLRRLVLQTKCKSRANKS